MLNASASFDVEDRHQIINDWFTLYQKPLYHYLYRFVGEPEQAADLVQDTFMRAMGALEEGTFPDNPSAWLYRIATNLAINAIRRRNRWRWLPLSDRHASASFESGVETAQQVKRCLGKLQTREAEALLLYEYAGLSCIEIAAQTGEEPATVRVRIHRARTRFRQHYEKGGDS
jgi:RNA polymerase sigma-70 factor, ECF subfamily